MGRYGLIVMGALVLSGAAQGDTYNLSSDWSEVSNPNGQVTLRQGFDALPHVDAWQRNLGGWSTFQPGWARSEDANTRLPFFFKSNGTEQFVHDFVEGDVVVHTWDSTNGSGSMQANILYDVAVAGTLSVSGSVWMGRDIGRAVTWQLMHNSGVISQGDLSSGDPYSRANPMLLTQGTGGVGAVTDINVSVGDRIELWFLTTSFSGDFVGIDLTIDNVPAPSGAGLLALAGLACVRRRRR